MHRKMLISRINQHNQHMTHYRLTECYAVSCVYAINKCGLIVLVLMCWMVPLRNEQMSERANERASKQTHERTNVAQQNH